MILQKRITRLFNHLTAELFYVDKNGTEILIDYKSFGYSIFRIFFNSSLKQKHYDSARKWLDYNQELHYKNTKDLS